MSASSVELHPCPLCGAEQGYMLRMGDNHCWFNVLCAGCHEIVAESRRSGHSAEGRNPAADDAWNQAGAYAARLRERIAVLEPCLGLLREVYDDGLKTNMRDWQVRANAALLAADAVGSAGGVQALLLAEFIGRLNLWSVQTFGPGPRAAAILDHLGKELAEIAAAPQSVEEWVDAAMLALDGAVRSGASPSDVAAALVAKLKVNQARSWPDWRTAEPGRAIEHNRDGGGER